MTQRFASTTTPAARRMTAHSAARFAASAGLAATLAVGMTAGCADPVITDPNNTDLSGSNNNTDGGMTVTSVKYSATPAATADFQSDASTPTWRQWKRDPHFATDQNDQYLFFAGSAFATEAWTLGYYKQTGAAPSTSSTLQQVLLSGAATWDTGDMTAPMVRFNVGSNKFTLYYAANGAPNKPTFVNQIGIATSSNGTVWSNHSATPALGVPAFDGMMDTSNPTTARPDAFGVTDPWVMTDGAETVMYYAGLDCSAGTSCTSSIFRTVSSDGGLTFPPGTVVLAGRQGVAEELGGVGGPSIYVANGLYTMAYTAYPSPLPRNRTNLRRAAAQGTISIATSKDGKTWTNAVASGNVLINKAASSYRSQGSVSPSLFMTGQQMKLYFGGAIDQSGVGVFYSIALADVMVSQ